MRGVDTNVLLRVLTADDPEMSAVAEELFIAAEESGDSLYLTTPVLCELVWTLRGSCYGYGSETVAEILERLLATPAIEIQNREAVQRALRDFEGGSGDFADYLIGHLAREAGCTETITVDRRLDGSPLFSVLLTA